MNKTFVQSTKSKCHDKWKFYSTDHMAGGELCCVNAVQCGSLGRWTGGYLPSRISRGGVFYGGGGGGNEYVRCTAITGTFGGSAETDVVKVNTLPVDNLSRYVQRLRTLHHTGALSKILRSGDCRGFDDKIPVRNKEIMFTSRILILIIIPCSIIVLQ